MHDRPLVITGFMGTGKTTVGRMVAQSLGWQFVDTDALLEQRHGAIPTIFDEVGEEGFRRLERDLVPEWAALRRVVVATGGGTLLDDASAELVTRECVVVCLTADPATIVDRLDRPEGRPLLATGDLAVTVRGLIAEREAAYGRFEQVDTSDRTPAEVAEAVRELHQELVQRP